MKKIQTAIIVMLSLSIITACGWRLRGSDGSFDIQHTVYLESASGQVYDRINKVLTKKQLIADITDADIQLVLGKEFFDRRTISIDNNANTQQYQLRLAVSYEILDPTNKPLTEKTTAELIRHYTFNQNAINSSDKEEQALRKEMVRQVARQILQRIIFLSKKTQ